MKLPKTVLPALAAVCLSVPALADDSIWFADYDLAAAEAKKTGKDLFVDFTGSDWCGWCIRLHKEVFDFEAFQKGVEQDFVLVALDFPRAEEVKAKVPNPQRNDELRDLHGVRGYPTILLMTADGEVFARTGYRPGGPEAYVANVTEIRASGKRALKEVGEKLGAWESAEGEAKLAAWDKLAELALTLDGDSPFAGRLADPLATAFETDPDNAQGRTLAAVKALMKLGLVDETLHAKVLELDPDNAEGLREQALEAQFGGVGDDATARAAIAALTDFEAAAKFKDTKLAARLTTNAATWLAGPLEDPEAAKPWAQKALDLKPEDPEQVAALEKIVAGE